MVPPEKFHQNIGDNGSYSVSQEELFALPIGSEVLVEDHGRMLAASASYWKECGVLKDGRIYLPVEYFVKKN